MSRRDEARFESESAPLRRERPDSLLRRKRFMAGGLAVEAWAVGEVLVEAERKAGQPAGRGGGGEGRGRRLGAPGGCGSGVGVVRLQGGAVERRAAEVR